jgi:alpha-tubulin suppressor-like RCC1 family protein
MYLWGANDSGQLGFETPEEDEQLVPRHLHCDLHVVDAAAGKSHTAIIDHLGRIHTWYYPPFLSFF